MTVDSVESQYFFHSVFLLKIKLLPPICQPVLDLLLLLLLEFLLPLSFTSLVAIHEVEYRNWALGWMRTVIFFFNAVQTRLWSSKSKCLLVIDKAFRANFAYIWSHQYYCNLSVICVCQKKKSLSKTLCDINKAYLLSICCRTIRPEHVVRSVYKATGCTDNPNNHVIYLEHVVVRITITHPRRGDLSINLTSPSGTKSQLLANR